MFPELDRCLTLFLVEPNYRRLLLSKDDDADAVMHVFVNTNGSQFTSSGFSTYLSRLLSRLTGRNATSNILRSSFVTNLFESSPSEAAMSSALLRHGERLQSETYDRRIPAHKKMEAQGFGRGFSKRDRDGEEPEIRRTKASMEFRSGMLVVVPFVDCDNASFLFAKILSINKTDAQLMELKPIVGAKNAFQADLKAVWTESVCALRVVDADYNHETNHYVMRTPVKELQ